jgi:sorbitol-specific phosphotransferase system component IIA
VGAVNVEKSQITWDVLAPGGICDTIIIVFPTGAPRECAVLQLFCTPGSMTDNCNWCSSGDYLARAGHACWFT